MPKNQHVVPHSEGWAVKGEGNQRSTSIYQTQQQAINAAREIAIKQQSEMFIHGKNGHETSMGKIRFHPKDREWLVMKWD